MKDYTVVGMLYAAIQTALLSCIRYWLYQDNLRVEAKKMYIAGFSISVGATLIWIASGKFAHVQFSVLRLFVTVIMYTVSCLVIREPLSKHTFTYSFIMAYDLTLEITATYIQYKFSHGSRDWVFALSSALLIAATFVPAVRYLKRIIQRLSMLGNDRLWGWLCVISLSFVGTNLALTYPPPDAPAPRDLLSRYLMMLGIIGLYIATSRAMETMREAAEAKAELNLVKKRVDMQQAYYERLVSQMDEVRRIRHDLRHHRAALSGIVKSGDISAMTDYLKSMPINEEIIPVSGNLAADSILLYYTDAAKRIGATVETEISISGKLPISDPDLCVILGNLLENAVEAQSHLNSGDRYIRVRAVSDENALTLAVDNRFNAPVKIGPDGTCLTSKQGAGHGLGISSVRVVCEKYGGILQLETDKDMFMAGVVIGL